MIDIKNDGKVSLKNTPNKHLVLLWRAFKLFIIILILGLTTGLMVGNNCFEPYCGYITGGIGFVATMPFSIVGIFSKELAAILFTPLAVIPIGTLFYYLLFLLYEETKQYFEYLK